MTQQPMLWADLEQNANQLDEAIKRRDAGALFVVNHSGGADSQAATIEVAQHVPPSQMLIVHATLGKSEWPGALEKARQHAADIGAPFIVAQSNSHPDLLSMVRRRFAQRPEVPSWPSASNRQCTSDLKRGPIEREIRRYAAARGIKNIVNVTGIRAQESTNRKKMSCWKRNTHQSVAGRDWMEWLPIHRLSREEVRERISGAGQELHPAYDCGNERLSCVFCIMASKNDLRNGAIQNPELYREHVELERETGYTLHMSRQSLPELTGISI